MQIFTIDAFTQEPWHGNPAATAIVQEFPDVAVMQSIAAEMNLSETAFAQPLAPNHFHLRWFTPLQEVNLCGHATLAMSHYLREIKSIDPALALTFQTRSGELKIGFEGELIVMDFPALPDLQPLATEVLAQLNQIMLDRPYECLGQAGGNIMVRLSDQKAVADFAPDFPLIAELAADGLIITSIADPNSSYDFVSRYFAPQIGINEDPVTGSTHCALTPYWAGVIGKNMLKARQLSKRSGDLSVVYLQDRGQDRVLLKGYAVTVMRGDLQFDRA